MYILVISLIILFAILLVLVILAQNSKGGGLTSQFGGSAASNIIGVKKTGDLLEKLTWGFIVAIMVLTLATNLITPGASNGSGSDIIDRVGQEAPTTPSQTLPSTGTDSTAPAPAPVDSTNK